MTGKPVEATGPNGLITPLRPVSMEATAGKNPVNHVGKIYNVLARLIAEKIYSDHSDKLSDVYVEILSQIGKPIDQPLIASVKIIPQNTSTPDLPSNVKNDIIGIVDEYLANIRKITELIINDQVILY
jgi:methionine adenosyltransferase (EC 2.5.1.6)